MRFLLSAAALAVLALGGKLPGMRQTHVPDEFQRPNLHRYDPQLLIENVEARNLTSFFCNASIYGTNTNGTCHNLLFPLFGINNNVEIRYGEARYADGIGEPDNEDRPEPREISNEICAQPGQGPPNIKQASRLLIFLGQFLDHDFALTLENEEEELELEVPRNDPEFRRPLFFARSQNCTVPDENGTLIRAFTDINTPWIDLGPVYGDTENRTKMLRAFKDGLMNTSLVNGLEFPPVNNNTMSLCGDIRCEENFQLFAFHTLFLREHNRLARGLKKFFNLTDFQLNQSFAFNLTNATLFNASNATFFNDTNATFVNATNGTKFNETFYNLTGFNITNVTVDEIIFQMARLRNIIQWQSLVWEFYLPYLLGRRTFEELTGPYEGHMPGVDPTASLLFTTAVYRYGHSGVSNDIEFQDGLGNRILNVPLENAFLTNQPIRTADQRLATAIFVGQGSLAHDQLEQRVVDGIRNTLFGRVARADPNTQSDLISRNIARSRDHGLQSLNYYREIFGLEPFECPNNPRQCFLDLVGEEREEDGEILFELYGDIEQCDVWVCGMAEESFEDSLLGETFTVVMAEQFNRMRLGDRIWYENVLSDIPTLRDEIAANVTQPIPTRLADIVRANGVLPNSTTPVVPGLENFVNEFILEDVYIAMIGEEEFQVEWAETEPLRRLLRNSSNNGVKFDRWRIEISSNGNDGFVHYIFITERSQLYLYLTNEEITLIQQGRQIEPGTDYEIMVQAQLSGAPDMFIRSEPVVLSTREVSTTNRRTNNGGGDNGLSGGAIAGIVIGSVAGVGLIGAGAYFASRRSYKNDEFNAAFF